MEPHKLRRWRAKGTIEGGFLYTCARPGRSEGKTVSSIPDQTVRKWVDGLPADATVIVSLLGRKKDGLSEFSYYTFSGGFDSAEVRKGRPTLKEWLDERYPNRFDVHEYPTVDMATIPKSTLSQIAEDIRRLLAADRVVVLVDSGGETRTGMVCRYAELVESFG